MAARAAGDGLLERVAWLGTAGHVLDFDDTYLPGIAHLSAPTAPAAIALAAALDRSVGDALDAYAAGFEAMGRLSRSHDLYEGGWHPTAVCGAAGAAHTAARLLGLDEERTGAAERLALLQAGGLRAAFGSDGKSLQVGMAAAAGVHAARIAASGVTVGDAMDHPAGFAAAFGAARDVDGGAAVEQNWIKPWPCCLMSHSAVQAASEAREALAGSRAPIEVSVHPVARRAAAYDDVADGLQAKFSIPYLVAYVVLHGEPEPAGFDSVDPDARALALGARAPHDATSRCARPRPSSPSTARSWPACPPRAGRRRRRWTRTRWPPSAGGWPARGSTACSTTSARRLRSCSTRWPEGGPARRRAAPGWRPRRRGRPPCGRRRSR